MNFFLYFLSKISADFNLEYFGRKNRTLLLAPPVLDFLFSKLGPVEVNGNDPGIQRLRQKSFETFWNKLQDLFPNCFLWAEEGADGKGGIKQTVPGAIRSRKRQRYAEKHIADRQFWVVLPQDEDRLENEQHQQQQQENPPTPLPPLRLKPVFEKGSPVKYRRDIPSSMLFLFFEIFHISILEHCFFIASMPCTPQFQQLQQQQCESSICSVILTLLLGLNSED